MEDKSEVTDTKPVDITREKTETKPENSKVHTVTKPQMGNSVETDTREGGAMRGEIETESMKIKPATRPGKVKLVETETKPEKVNTEDFKRVETKPEQEDTKAQTEMKDIKRVDIETEEGHIKTVDAETQTENIKTVDNQTQTKEIRAHPVVIKTKDLHDFDDNAEDNDTVEGQSTTKFLCC